MRMTDEELKQRTSDIVDLLMSKNEEAKEAGDEQHAHFMTAVAHTLGSIIGFDLKPQGYGPMLSTVIEALTDGMQIAAAHKGVKATFIKVVRD